MSLTPMLPLVCLYLALSACMGEKAYQAAPRTAAVEANEAGKVEDKESPPDAAAALPAPVVSPVEPMKPVATPTPSARTSNGSGGATGMLEVPFTDSTGLASTYKINVPTDVSQKVYGLHIHLHGDGGGGYTDFPNKEARNELIGVTVKAPNTNLQWGRVVGREHARYLNELIQKELIKKYNVNLDRIFFSSASGGSYFMTGSFIPEYGQLYNSGVFAMCGGEAPRVAFTDPKVMSKFRIHWEVTAGERQDILTSVQASQDAYKLASTNAGIPADQQAKIQTSTKLGAGGHCVFDGVSYTSGIQQAIDTKFKMILPQ